jgi:hypothetical protein
MDTNRLKKLAGLNEATNANDVFSDIRDIGDEFKKDRIRVRAILRMMIKAAPHDAKIMEDFLASLISTIFEDQERGKKDDLR